MINQNKLKKYLFLLLFGLLSINLYSDDDIENSVVVKVTAVIGKKLSVLKTEDINFGNVIQGQKNVVAYGGAKIDGRGKVKLECVANQNGIKQPITKNTAGFLELPIYNGETSLNTTIYLEGDINTDTKGIVELKGEKELKFKGVIKEVPRDQISGEYKGTFTVRATYVD